MSRQLEATHPSVPSFDDHAHVVRFYETESELIPAITSFLVPALIDGRGALVIATAPHRAAIARSLSEAGCDIGALSSRGCYVALDAEGFLDRVMNDGELDEPRLCRELGGALDPLSDGATAHAFGELVAILWARGDVANAIRVEEIWNQLARTRSFRLLCAYPMSGFEKYPDAEAFREICDHHSRVVPAESYAAETSEDGGFSRIAALEQAASAERLETEALKLKQAQLEEDLGRVSEREAIRREFVALAIHDIRSPAAVVTGFLQLLHKNWRSFDATTVDELLTKGISQTKRIQHLVNDLLTVAEIDAVGFTYDLAPLDLTPIVDDAVSAARQAGPDGIRFELDVPKRPTLVLGDQARQMQILDNLLSNAARYSPPGSEVRVTVTPRSADVVVTVSDDGVGITPEDLPRLFKPFSRLRPAGYSHVKGSGLGLHICKLLVEGQGGSIGIEPQTRGTTVWYTVPKAGRSSS